MKHMKHLGDVMIQQGTMNISKERQDELKNFCSKRMKDVFDILNSLENIENNIAYIKGDLEIVPRVNGSHQIGFFGKLKETFISLVPKEYRFFEKLNSVNIDETARVQCGFVYRSKNQKEGWWHRDDTDLKIIERTENDKIRVTNSLVYLDKNVSTEFCLNSQYGECDHTKYKKILIESENAGDYVSFDARLIHRGISCENEETYILWFYTSERTYIDIEDTYKTIYL